MAETAVTMATSLMNDTFITAVDTLTAPHGAMIPRLLLPIRRPSPTFLATEPPSVSDGCRLRLPRSRPRDKWAGVLGKPSAPTPVGRKQKRQDRAEDDAGRRASWTAAEEGLALCSCPAAHLRRPALTLLEIPTPHWKRV